MNTTEEINVGVDTGKAQLDIYVQPLDQAFSVPNTAAGIRDALQQLKKVEPTRIVIEATGRLELPFVIAAQQAGLAVSVVNPLQVRKFAGASGTLAKTDPLDARIGVLPGLWTTVMLGFPQSEENLDEEGKIVRRADRCSIAGCRGNHGFSSGA